MGILNWDLAISSLEFMVIAFSKERKKRARRRTASNLASAGAISSYDKNRGEKTRQNNKMSLSPLGPP